MIFDDTVCPKKLTDRQKRSVVVLHYTVLYGWMIELSRVDICTEVSMLSSHMALLRQGHLEASLHVMLYLLLHHNS